MNSDGILLQQIQNLLLIKPNELAIVVCAELSIKKYEVKHRES